VQLKDWCAAERMVIRRYATGSCALLDAEDIEFDIYKCACESMELSGLKMLLEQEVQAGSLQL
jgi:hypothetical protein